jgi:murein DD-endopeptidase MepM/ murein hydrolase activator NlpD
MTSKTPSDLHVAAQEMEAMFLKQVLQSGGTFRGTGATGSDVQADMFAGALADAVTKSGGIGLAQTLERSLAGVAPLPTSTITGALSPSIAVPPVAHGKLTSGFGPRVDPVDGSAENHSGLDIGAPEGATIRAVSGGVVKSAGPRGGYGNAVEVDHGGGLTSLYAHASSVLVQPGQHLAAGQAIGTVGHTGHATGPHLHLEVRQNGHAVDASKVLKLYQRRVDSHGEDPEAASGSNAGPDARGRP